VLVETFETESVMPPLAATSSTTSSAPSQGLWLAAIGAGLLSLPVLGANALLAADAPLAKLLPAIKEGIAVNALQTFFGFLFGGQSMLHPALFSIPASALLLVCAAFLLLRRQGLLMSTGALLSLALVVGIGLPGTAAAFVVRDKDDSTVGADETISGSLFIAGEDAEIKGIVDGDVFAAGQRVSVSGTIKGSLYTVAQDIDVTGIVEGSIHAAARGIQISGQVSNSAYMLGQELTVAENAKITRDLFAASQTLVVNGECGRDLGAAGSTLTLKGAVGGDLGFAGERLQVNDGAKVLGNLKVRIGDESKVKIAEGAQVSGSRDIAVDPGLVEENEYTEGNFYIGIVIDIVGGALVALLLLLFLPRVLPLAPKSAGEVARSMGLGFLVLVATPIGLLLIALTVIGLPLAALGAAGFGMLCYLAKISTAVIISQRLLPMHKGSNARILLSALLGMAIVVVLGAMPVVGFGVKLVVLLLGLGMLSAHYWKLWQSQRADA
jgi:cytoskeletal protein CcmA (bactofilin family)